MATKQSTARSASRKPARKIAPKKPPTKAVLKPAAISKPPALGQIWPAQGGIYLGIIRGDDGQPDAHLVANLGNTPKLTHPWGPTAKVTGATSHRDGLANTRAMAKAGSAIARAAMKVNIDGHKDFYLPARDEARLAYINGREHFEKDGWYWTSTQFEFLVDSAWVQYFGNGDQTFDRKSDERRAFVVRRVPIQ